MKRKFVGILLSLMVIAIVALASFWSLSPAKSKAAFPPPSVSGLHVFGNKLVNKDNQEIVPAGVGFSGTEYSCVQNQGIFDGPHDAAAVDVMASWKMNAVRIPINEDCWLGINGVPAQYGGKNYQQAITDYVNLLHAKNMLAILDLHWNAPGTILAKKQQAMPDLDHSVDLWKSVATTFKGDSSTLFDLYNEPFTTSWDCWRDGSTAASTAPCTDVTFAVAGMQTLIDAVRSTGATNPVLAAGLRWGNDMTGWLSHKPDDSGHNLMAAYHNYNFNQCITTDCWESQVLPVARFVPLLMTEVGETDCKNSFIDNLMNWADRYNIGYIPWAWNNYGCGFPALLSKTSDGTPSVYGQGVQQRFQALYYAGLKGYGEATFSHGPFGEDRASFKFTAPLKNVTVTIVLQKDVASLHYLNAVTTSGDSKFDITHADTPTALTYIFTLKSGEVLQPLDVYHANQFSAFFKTNGEIHDAKNDTFVLNGTTDTDGQAVVLSGSIVS